MADVSIAVSLQDNYSSKISDMAAVSTQFKSQLSDMGTTVAQLETIQSDYTSRIAKQRVEVVDVRKELASATAAYKSLGDEASALRLEEASASFSLATQELKDLEKQALSTDNQIRSLATSADSLARTEYTSSLGLSDSSSSSVSSTFSSVWAAGAADSVSDAVVEATTTGISSAFGSDTGSVISSALTGAISGAVMGTVVPGLGTAVGAVVGSAVGLVSGATSAWSAEDDYFTEYVATAVSNGQTATAETLSSGATTAASRETDQISFATLLGSDEAATSYLTDLKAMSNSTPFLYDDLTSISKTLLAYGLEEDSILGTVGNVGDAGAALGLGTDDISTLATALGRMTSTDKASLEYMNLLTERGISAIDWVAERDGITVAEVYDNISDSAYSGKEMAEFLAAKMDELYGGSMEEQSKTTSGLASTLEGWETEIATAMGEGYNTERNTGVSEQIDWLSGEAGEAMQELDAIIGQNEAYMENLQEQYTREALDALLTGAESSLFGEDASVQLSQMHSDYLEALAEYEATGSQEAALELQNLSQTAETMGTMAYESSEQYKLVIEAEEDLIDATRDLATAFTGWADQYALQQSYTQGRLSITVEDWETLLEGWGALGLSVGDTTAASAMTSEVASMDTSEIAYGDWTAMGAASHASGLETVPYDGYLALLHEGERVQTAREVRSTNSDGVIISISIAQLTVREEADVDAIAESLARKAKLEMMAGVY